MGTALITGASAGIGADLARLFAADGHDIVLVARREERLKELASELKKQHGIQAHVMPADLANRSSPIALHQAVHELSLEVDFLVNNAGFGSQGPFIEQDLPRELNMIEVNVSALVHLTGLFLPEMVERGRGRILNIASTAGFQPGPFMATYYATKAFVLHWTEALAHELKETGVSATVHCPGATQTEFAEKAGNDKTKLFQNQTPATSEEVAKHAFDAMMSGKRLAIHGFTNKVGVQALRFSPRAVVQKLAAGLNRPA